ncbi:MAG TPA: methyltransferase domain-containing protein, partial [Flavisolibacter sp.]|nr:methyltransferase domain-containing protein [Flavisolibacter sp.]
NGEMLALAQTRISDERIKWQAADAQCLPFEDESFDHVICQFGVMFFPEKQQSFNEVYRVLQTGGTYVFNVWDEMLYNPRSFIIKQVMDDMLGEGAPDFMKKGPYSFFNKEEIRETLQRAGFQTVKIEVVKKTAAYSSPDDVIRGFVEGSPLSSFIHKKPVAIQEAIRLRLREELIAQGAQYGTAIPLQALVIAAVK